jgi:hypothetical protein
VSERRVSGQLPSHAPRGEQKKAARATPHDPSAVSRQGLAPDFTSRLMHDLSHAYTAVIVVAIILVAPDVCARGVPAQETGFHSRSTDAAAGAVALERSSMGWRPQVDVRKPAANHVSAPGRIRTCDTGFTSRTFSTIAARSRLLLCDNVTRALLVS